ncbi:unnamed protein product, partial [Allacma fusca]
MFHFVPFAISQLKVCALIASSVAMEDILLICYSG